MTLPELLQRYLETERLSLSLYQAIRGGWDKFLAFARAHGLSRVQDVDRETVEAFHKKLLWEPNTKGQWLKGNSVHTYVRCVRKVLRWGAAHGFLQRDPTVGLLLPRPVQPTPQLLSWDELQAVLDAPDRTAPVGLRDALLFRLLAENSLGLQPLLELTRETVRLLELEAATQSLLEDYLQHGRPQLAQPSSEPNRLFLTQYGSPLPVPAAAARLNETARQLGLGKRLPSRVLRKSFQAALQKLNHRLPPFSP